MMTGWVAFLALGNDHLHEGSWELWLFLHGRARLAGVGRELHFAFDLRLIIFELMGDDTG